MVPFAAARLKLLPLKWGSPRTRGYRRTEYLREATSSNSQELSIFDPPRKMATTSQTPKQAKEQAKELPHRVEIEERSHSTRVLSVEDGVIMIEGLPQEVSVGTQLRFQNDAIGVLLWRHDIDIAFALTISDRMPIVDAIPAASKQFCVETGEHMRGRTIKGIDDVTAGSRTGLPLLNEQLGISSRQCIDRPLSLQHMGIDVLTPIGRGQCLLFVSEASSVLSDTARHVVASQLAQKDPVFVVYACLSKNATQMDIIRSKFQAEGLMDGCVFLEASQNLNLAERYAIMCAGLSMAEDVRDAGGDAVVILNGLEPLVDVWNLMQRCYGRYRPSFKQAEDEDALVEVDGTFMAAKTAERRRFFSSVLQRAAQVSNRLGGGSLTLLPMIHGSPASGIQYRAHEEKIQSVRNDPKLPEDLKEKLLVKLQQSRPQERNTSEASVPTFIVEEFMSIADGQVIVEDIGEEGISVDPLQSISRIGGRAYPPALESFAKDIRLNLAQAHDASQFRDGEGTWNDRAQMIRTALIQRIDRLCPLSRQVVLLLVLEQEEIRKHSVASLPSFLDKIWNSFETNHREILRQIDAGQLLNASLRQDITKILKDML